MNDDIKNLRIVFMGTPEFAATSLRAMLDAGYNIVACYSQPPRPKGRGHQLQKSPVHELADAYNIPVFTPTSLRKDENAAREFCALKADIAVVAAYGLILPQSILDAPTYGCINIHASILPRWRGASPIHHAIWKGDQETGITIMRMSAGLDEGDMISVETTPITPHTTTQSLHDDLAKIGGDMICKILARYAVGDIPDATRQDHSQSNYASLLKKEDGIINWSHTAHDIDRQVRALNPWPATVTTCHEKRFKITAGEVIENAQNTNKNGVILNILGDVAAGDNTTYRIHFIQPENSKAMKFSDALNGGHIKIGDQFS
jgi:methionyl-tRNA formyltransferase